MRRKQNERTTLGSVSLGVQFVYRSEYAELFGSKPPLEGQVLTVVGFKPRYVNQIVVQAPCGCVSLLRLRDVESQLNKALQANHGLAESKDRLLQ